MKEFKHRKYIKEDFSNSFDGDESNYTDIISAGDYEKEWKYMYGLVDNMCSKRRIFNGELLDRYLFVGNGDYFSEPIYPFIPGVLSINHKDGGEASCYPIELVAMIFAFADPKESDNPITVAYRKFRYSEWEGEYDAGEAWQKFAEELINNPCYKMAVECITTYAFRYNHYNNDIRKGSEIPGWSMDLATAEIKTAMNNIVKYNL